MSSKMFGIGNHDRSPDAENVARESQTNRRNKWQSGQQTRPGQYTVTFLSGDLDDEDVREKFSLCGHVTDIHKNRSRTFVRYNTEEEAKAAEEMYKDELGASIAIRKDRTQKTADGGKSPQNQIPIGQNEKIEVRIVPLNKAVSEEEACQEILDGANHISHRFRIAQDCNMMYVDFPSREDAQKLIDEWHQKEWRDGKLSVHFVEKKINQGNSESRGKTKGERPFTGQKGERPFAGQSRRKPEWESREDDAGGLPRKESWDDDEPVSTHSSFVSPGKGSTETFSSVMDRNNNSSKSSGGKKWEQLDMPSLETVHPNLHNGDDQGRHQGGGPRSPMNGGFASAGGLTGHPWQSDDSPSPRKFSNSRLKQGKGGSQDARFLVKNQEPNGSRGNGLPNGGFRNRPREQSEALLGEKESPWKHHSPSAQQQGRRGHNGPSPRKLPSLAGYGDEADMPPLETMSLDKENPFHRQSDSPPMPVLEAVGISPDSGFDHSMPPLETAPCEPLDSLPQVHMTERVEGLILTNLPCDCNEIVVKALLKKYNVIEVRMFSKSGAFVKFKSQEEAKRARAELDNLEFEGRCLSANLQYLIPERGSAVPSASKQQGPQGKNPLKKTWPELLDHYMVISKALDADRHTPRPGQTLRVKITYITSADCFWAQEISSEDDMQRLVELANLEGCMESHLHEQAKGGRCCAPYVAQGRRCYYRAWMLCPPTLREYLVFFVDYGNTEKVPKKEVMRLDANFWNLPNLARPFKLREGTTSALKENEELRIHEVDEKTHLAICSRV